MAWEGGGEGRWGGRRPSLRFVKEQNERGSSEAPPRSWGPIMATKAVVPG